MGRLGFALVEAGRDFDVNKTLAELVESENLRYWEGLPVVLANAAKEGNFDYDKVARYVTDEKLRQCWHNLFLLSLALYKQEGMRFDWFQPLTERLSSADKKELEQFRKSLSEKGGASFLGYEFSAERLRTTFENYYRAEEQKIKTLQETQGGLSLEFALSQVFSPKQKELFKKKLQGEPLTKTEREYFSRAVKKKVHALANGELHELARRLLE